MSNKQLKADVVLSELSGQSVYFKKEPSTPIPTFSSEKIDDTKVANMVSDNQAAPVSKVDDATIETIRKAVKVAGKEAATYRFSADEKRSLEDQIYAYSRRGIRTSGNEIIRIAINTIMQDHRENGENSILALVLKVLHE